MNRIIVVSFSGGRTSGRFIDYCETVLRPQGYVIFYVFMDTGAEDPETYKYIKKIHEEWNIPLFCIRLLADTPLGTGNHFQVIPVSEIKQDYFGWNQMLAKYGTPYQGGAFCTDRMKTGIFNTFCDSMFGKGNYDVYLGIRADEPARFFTQDIVRELKRIGYEDHSDMLYLFKTIRLNDGVAGPYDLWDGMGEPDNSNGERDILLKMLERNHQSIVASNIYYMAEFMDDTKEDVLNWWKQQSFDLNLDEWCGNCVFCIKKSVTKVSAAIKDRPDDYVRFVNLLESPDVRVLDTRAGKHLVMYRGKNTLRSIAESVSDVPRDQVIGRLRGVTVETGGCSESCDAFNKE